METINIRLAAFEGPLDLLYHLIEKNEIDIYDIPIVLITEQYLEYVSSMETEDLNEVAEKAVKNFSGKITECDIRFFGICPKCMNN